MSTNMKAPTWKQTLIFTGVLLLLPILYHAVVGFACLYMTEPVLLQEKPCSMVQEQSGKEWCLTPVKDEQPLTIHRMETQADIGAYDLQPTINGKQLQ